jgi:hypothetical protein
MDLKQSATIFTSPIGVETEFIIPSWAKAYSY